MRGRLSRSLAGGLVGVAVLIAPIAHAQPYPAKPIRLVVPYTPGAGTDTIARILAQKVGESLGQQVVIENRPGAGGTIGTEVVAKAPADGYTLLFAPTSHAINPGIYPKLGYDTLKDFAPISVVASLPVVLAVAPAVPATSVRELVALAKSTPDQLTMASSGNGTVFHLTGELFKEAAGIRIVHVPFKGGAPAVAAVLGGQVSMTFETSVTLLPHIRSGKLRALGVAGTRRIALLPDVPTLGEAGFPTILAENWYGLYAPAGTPKETIARLYAELDRAIHSPDVREKLAQQGAEIRENTPEQSASFLRAEMVKWAKVIKDSGAKVD
ncbi:MAG: tripartite tricarboxylate transporter substrate binding protein [Betaproteobacteria bacterium]